MITADSILVFSSTYPCWQCHTDTPVTMLGAPAGAKELDGEETITHDEAIILTYIDDLNYDAIDVFRNAGGKVSKDESLTYGERYWMNHCARCDAKIGDHYLQKPGFAFFPTTDEEMARVTMRTFSAPLHAVAGVSIGIAQHIVDAQDKA